MFFFVSVFLLFVCSLSMCVFLFVFFLLVCLFVSVFFFVSVFLLFVCFFCLCVFFVFVGVCFVVLFLPFLEGDGWAGDHH